MLELILEEENINEFEVAKIKLIGILNSETAFDFYDLIQKEMIKGFRYYLIQANELEYISSAGIGILIKIQNQIKEKKAKLVYTGFNSEIKMVLNFTNINDEILSFDSFDETVDILFKEKEEEYFEEKIYSITEEGEVVESISPDIEYEAISIDYDKNSTITKIETNRLSLADEEEFTLEEIATSEVEAIQADLKKEDPKQTGELKIKIPFLNKTPADPNVTTILDSITDFEPNKEDEFHIQNLSNKKDTNFTVLVVNCGNCGAKIRITKQGKQKCPSCGYKFILRQSGSISTIEKI